MWDRGAEPSHRAALLLSGAGRTRTSERRIMSPCRARFAARDSSAPTVTCRFASRSIPAHPAISPRDAGQPRGMRALHLPPQHLHLVSKHQELDVACLT